MAVLMVLTIARLYLGTYLPDRHASLMPSTFIFTFTFLPFSHMYKCGLEYLQVLICNSSQ